MPPEPPRIDPPASPALSVPTPEDLENSLARLWAELLELPAISRQDSFVALGGDSISATQLVSRLRDQFQLHLPLDAVFEQQLTIARLADLITHREPAHASPTTGLPAIAPQGRDRPLPVSHCQRRMWLVQQFAPDTTAYNVPFALRLTGPLNRAHLVQAIETVWSRHEVFRTRFTMTPDGLGQVMADANTPVPVVDTDFGAHRGSDQEQLVRDWLRQMASTPFDMTRGPLWHCHLLRLNDQDHILAWVAHHIIVDLWANLILARELGEVYTALRQGHAPPPAPRRIDCADHAHWQVSPEVTQHLAPHQAYWLDQLKDLPALALPTDRPALANWHRSGARVTRAFKRSMLDKLAQRAATGGHSPFMIMLAGLNVLLARQTRQTDIAIATPIANRQHPDTEHLVASLVNTLVMRTDLAGDLTFQQVLDRVKTTALKAYAHQDLPFDLLVEKLGHAHRQHDTPLGLSVMFNASNAAPGPLQFDGLQAKRFLFDRGATQFPLSFVVDLDRTQSIFLEYADQLFDAATAEALLDHYLALLDQVLDAPQAPLSSLHWLSPTEHARLLAWNQTTRPPAEHPSVASLIQARTRQHPHATAVRFQGQSISYGDLETQARHIARALRDQGIGRGHRVGICLERNPKLLAAVWATWMTGAAYVPLDPAYPVERLRFMAADAKLSQVITHPTLESRLEWPPGLSLLVDDAIAAPLQDQASHDEALGDDPAYVIYTSGSTGQPKGVVVPHRAVVNFLTSMARTPGLTAQDRLLAVTTLSFDISVLELMLPLTVGAQIVMASHDDVLDGHALKALIEQHQVTAMQATPSTWRLLMDAGWAGKPRDFKALVGGEPLNQDLARQLLNRASQVWNMYGPTETTVWSTCWPVANPSEGIRIGRPIDNTQVWILDEHGHPCPIGVPGEIVIGGAGVADGYWQRDTLTRERFLPDPFEPTTPNAPKARLYRTGDLGRWHWNGELEHLGRLDVQIKVRGHRIEPGEIETQLSRHPAVAQTVVIAREDHPGDVRLVAYIVPRQAMPAKAVLREHARHCLPDHMQPQHYVELPRIPLLANGKIDRQSLPAPVVHPADSLSEASVRPLATDTQKLLALIWQELLGVDHIQPSDNFFDLGGHSLLAVQAIAKMEKVTGKRVSARRYIFETLAQLASSYDQATAQAETPLKSAPGPGLLQRWLGRKPKP